MLSSLGRCPTVIVEVRLPGDAANLENVCGAGTVSLGLVTAVLGLGLAPNPHSDCGNCCVHCGVSFHDLLLCLRVCVSTVYSIAQVFINVKGFINEFLKLVCKSIDF